MQARYEFNASGYLNRVKNLSTGATYYTLDTVTAEGQLEQMTFGNGIKTQNLYHSSSGNLDEIRTGLGGGSAVQNFHFDFSTIGNLAYRADANAGVGERLTAAGAYDAQNRLTSVQRVAHTADHTSGAVQTTTSFTYNALGNLLTKGGITGTYNYAATPQSSCPAGYTTTPGPHAVRRTGSSSTNYRHYCYDRNGNETRGWNYILNRQRTQTWTSYNLPASITENGTSIAFSYGADRQRFRQVNNFTGTTTIYVEGLFDREVKGALVNDVHYIVANGQAVATFSSSNDSATSTRYLHRDHVGSVTHVTNETGTLVDTFAYDAWGARRDPSNWQDYAGQPSPPPSLRRPQFTGHEGLHDVGIVHMNGRIYDPKLGRVLSADPFVQFAGDGQSYNRYSYALNNPLAYTDPSGFLAERVCFLSACGAAGSARVGAIGSGSSRPQIGVTKTIRFGGGWSGGFSIPFANPGWGAGTTCPSGMLCQSGESEPRASSPDLTIWMSTPGSTVTYTPYAGLIADDTGESRGGALASSTIAGYERNPVGRQPVSPRASGRPVAGESPLNTTRRLFKGPSRLSISVAGDTVTISGSLHSTARIHAEGVRDEVMKALDGQIFEVADRVITLRVNLVVAEFVDDADVIVRRNRGASPKESYRSNAEQAGKYMDIWGTETGRRSYVWPHEFLHSVGFGDTYYDAPDGTSVTFPGHDNDIMGSDKGVLQPYHIQVLMERYGRTAER